MQSLSKFRKPPSNKAMGIEIETVLPKGFNIPYGSYLNFFYVTRDGSIYHDYDLERGVEFVSQPLTPVWLKREIHKLYNRVNGWDNNNTCGIHIHVSRKWLSSEKASVIYKWLQSLTESEQINLFGRTDNGYCSYVERFASTRYAAINVENEHTIEFRMFRSGDNEWACYCVDMVEYLVQNAYKLNLDAAYAFRDMKLGNT